MKTADEGLAVGDAVELVGLTASPQLNGQTGVVVTSLDTKKGRYGVLLVGDANPKALRPGNLAVLSGLAADAVRAAAGESATTMAEYVCFVCNRPATRFCTGCKATPYCSKKCEGKNWMGDGQTIGHEHLCKKAAALFERSRTVLKVDFPSIRVRSPLGPFTDNDPGPIPPRADRIRELIRESNFDQIASPERTGVWPLECADFPQAYRRLSRAKLEQVCAYDGEKMFRWAFGALDDGLDPECLDSLRGEAGSVCSWDSLYRAMQLCSFHWAALILDNAATIFWIITKASKQNSKQPEVIHILGAEKEAYQIPLILPVLDALLQRKLTIIMVGDSIPREMNKFSARYKQVSIQVLSQTGKYFSGHIDHSPGETLTPPDLAIALNMGLGAYEQWQLTVGGLMWFEVPLYCTDYSEYSADNACENFRRMVATGNPSLHKRSAVILQHELNPFRQPIDRRGGLRRSREELCANAYIFGISHYV